jgi:hypothetical protein
MSFVSTGFENLDRMIAGSGGCMGFPRGGLTLVSGGTGSGKTRVMQVCCNRAHKRGLSVVYITTEARFDAPYPVIELSDLDEVSRFMTTLLLPGRKNKVDLLVLDALTQMTSDLGPDSELADHARRLGALFRRSFGQSVVVGTIQSRRLGGGLDTLGGSSSLAFLSRSTLSISKLNEGYHIDLVKSRVSVSGVSCVIRPSDMEDFDRSNIPTRYQRILRGSY